MELCLLFYFSRLSENFFRQGRWWLTIFTLVFSIINLFLLLCLRLCVCVCTEPEPRSLQISHRDGEPDGGWGWIQVGYYKVNRRKSFLQPCRLWRCRAARHISRTGRCCWINGNGETFESKRQRQKAARQQTNIKCRVYFVVEKGNQSRSLHL